MVEANLNPGDLGVYLQTELPKQSSQANIGA